MDSNTLEFNGIDGTTGEYLLAPITAEELSVRIRGQELDADLPAPARKQLHDELKWRKQQATEQQFAPEEGVDPKDLAQSGWGIVFPAGAGEAVREALGELLSHRKSQAGALYREFTGADGYRLDETKAAFLSRHGAASGWVKPEKMPYYLMLVGTPEEIPYQFQYQLDVQHAVGRLSFDTLEEYAQYARSVVASEGTPLRTPSVAFAGVSNPDDGATALSSSELVAPLADRAGQDQPSWAVTKLLGTDATKAKLLPLFGGDQTPSLVFTASHGMGFPADHPYQLAHQGALLCQDWPGPKQHRGEIPRDYYLSAEDIVEDAKLLGLMTFHFACYGAGTPKLDNFPQGNAPERGTLARESFVGRLPQRMLGHPKGGALASVGHVDRAWGYSFRSGNDRQLVTFESMLKRLMEGHPVGSAMEAFNGYYGEVATDLTEVMETAKWSAEEAIDHLALAGLWTRHNDARAYAIVGDPAVRLNVSVDAKPESGAWSIKPVEMSGQPADQPTGAGTSATAPNESFQPQPEPAGSSVVPPPSRPDLVIRVDVDDSPPDYSPSRPAGPTPEVDFGVRETAADLVSTLSELVASVGKAIQSAVTEATSLRVVTYTSDNLETVTLDKESGRFAGSARLRAVTRLSIDGDTLLCLPEADGEVDERIWAIHSEAVEHAQAYRANILKAVLDAAAGLIPSAR